MSAASKAFKITTSLVCISSFLIIVISAVLLRLAITETEAKAHTQVRQVILQANGNIPEWHLIERDFALAHFYVFDMEANETLIDFHSEPATIAVLEWLENMLRPPLERQVVHAYEVGIQLNHQSLIAVLIESTAWIVTFIFFIGLLTGLLSAKGVKKRNTDDIGQLSEALRQLSNKEKVRLEGKLSSEYGPIKEAIKALESKLLSELKEAQINAATLEHQAFYDSLTDLGNKSKFKAFLLPKLKVGPTTHFGLLAIIRGSALQQVNESSGYNAGDDYIRHLKEVVENTASFFQQPSIFRLNSSDIAIVLDFAPKNEYEKLGVQLENQFNDLARQLNLEEVANIGITLFQSGDDISELMCRCDNAISIASTRSGNSWHFSETPIEGALQGRLKWRAMISEIIDNSRVVLYGQKIIPLNNSTKVYSELQARFFNGEGEQVPTTGILAEAQSNDLLIRLDKTIVEHATELIRHTAGNKETYAINLSNSSILDAHFCIWLERHLLRDPAITRRLVFEVSEHGLTADISAGRRIIDIIHRVGSRFTIEHFGSSILSLKYFRELRPDYVKLDASHSNEILEDKKLQYFIRTLVDITHQMGVKVIAEAVETVEQKQLFENLNIDAIQGYFVGKPVPIGSRDSADVEQDEGISGEIE